MRKCRRKYWKEQDGCEVKEEEKKIKAMSLSRLFGWFLLAFLFLVTASKVVSYITSDSTSYAVSIYLDSTIAELQDNSYTPTLPFSDQSARKGSKWIVVTSVQEPTEDIKRLASYDDWTVVVVGDTKTPDNWSYPGVHYLSMKMQESMGFATVRKLPTKSYTRKNAGYLYEIAHGAEWIYDTDDDNKPYGKGLDQFSYSLKDTKSLRYVAQPNGSIDDNLFNPYRHFGRPEMWPRGFPLENIKNHDHLDGSYRLCRKQRPPAVQQGIVQRDPDVDAIYRLLHADKENGLDESFNKFAPPIILGKGTYAPWNSQNTLFSKRAFYGLFLPTSVAFRVTDIWRSYFTQALLHAAGETISFVPVNAIQKRNAHSYLKDFKDELDVYAKAGEIVKVISEWDCKHETMDKCTIELAEIFAAKGFWGEIDKDLVIDWVNDLLQIGYKFPEKAVRARPEDSITEESKFRDNCRRAHVVFGNESEEQRAQTRIDNFADLKDWCTESNSAKTKEWSFPAAENLAENFESEVENDNKNTVAIISNNYQWDRGMGMLQRMYEANFAMLIFCGHYPQQGRHSYLSQNPDGMNSSDTAFPHLKRPISYIDLSNEEVAAGYLMYYCFSKVDEMNLQNVKGYVMFSDDAIYNYWTPFNHEIIQGAQLIIEGSERVHWWNDDVGFAAINRTSKRSRGPDLL